jgi:hypothetical protein
MLISFDTLIQYRMVCNRIKAVEAEHSEEKRWSGVGLSYMPLRV